jgi:eukaryotic translation initiation factor 2C
LCSLIPPARYADLACKRGRLYLNELLNFNDEGLVYDDEVFNDEVFDDEEVRRNADDRARLMWGNGVHQDVADTMFYI